MTVKLNKTGFDHAMKLVGEGHFVWDERDAWSDDQPSTDEENEFIEQHGLPEYAKWHLGFDDEKSENTKGRFEFPYGDFFDLHRCALLAAESRAGQYKHQDIEAAAKQLRELIDEKMKKEGKSTSA
jgi:hypothetical protein